jgi:arylformamidase
MQSQPTATWQNLSDAERERQYSPSSAIGGNYQPFIDAYAQRSQLAFEQTKAGRATWRKLRYGDQKSQSISLCVPASTHVRKPGLLVFIHGGYWQELSAKESLFPAYQCLERGIAFAAIDYTLAPKASVSYIAAECRNAVQYLQVHADSLGVDTTRIVIAGSSAGAHLAAMVCASPLGEGICGAILVSGIYELTPLVGTSINKALALDGKTARAESPQHLTLKRPFPPTFVCYGEIETSEFKRQSETFAEKLRERNTRVACTQIPGKNHFDVILDLANHESIVGATTLSFLDHG